MNISADDMLEPKEDLTSVKAEQKDQTDGWNEMDIDERCIDIQGEEASVLKEEPIANEDNEASLKMTMKKGYPQKEPKKRLNTMSQNLDLLAQNRMIDGERCDDMDKKYRKFVPDFATISTPLTDPLRKGAPNTFHWVAECVVALSRIKCLLSVIQGSKLLTT